MKSKTQKLIVFSGAGISAESGIPTFRDDGGLWTKYKDTLVDIMKWKSAYPDVHAFFNERREEMRKAQPNAAHKLVAKWEKTSGFEVINLTQNIDDLFEKAGCQNVIHLHGRVNELKCMACGRVWSQLGEWNIEEDACSCGCRKGIKPNVIFFGEEAPEYRKLFRTIDELAVKDIWVTVGTSQLVIPIHRLLDKHISKVHAWNAPWMYLVDKDPNPADSGPYHTVYKGLASEQLPEIEKQFPIFRIDNDD